MRRRYSRKTKQQLTGYAVVFLLVAGAVFVWLERAALQGYVARLTAPDLPEERGPVITTLPTNRVVGTPIPSPTSEGVGAVHEINLGVPFSSQAPHGDWELPYQETCEEASAMLVDAFWTERTFTPDGANAELLELVAWQQAHLGFYFHTTVQETASILRGYYGYGDVRVYYDITADDIRRELTAGRPVIVPAAGRLLGNPYFRQPGPVYHMLVVKGFLADGTFITNDVGTRRGHSFLYDEQTLVNAIHDVPSGGDDWPVGVDPAEYILTGRKAMIVVYP